MVRPDWDEYFMMVAQLAAVRSTCLSNQVGAVIVKDRQILATGYNGPPSGLPHCTDQGFCYEGVTVCGSSPLPSRAIHAEANAIAQAAKHGISTNRASIYVTLEPCLSCLKLIMAAGIYRVYYGQPFDKSSPMSQEYIDQGLVLIQQVQTPTQINLSALGEVQK